MNTTLIDGRKLKTKILKELKLEVNGLKEKNITPHLCVVQLGHDPASDIYVKHKQKVAKELGIKFTWEKFEDTISYEELEKEIEKLNVDDNINGIIIQFPLPKSFSKSKVAQLVASCKDADGIHPVNQNIIENSINKYAPVTCTPKGIMRMLDEYDINPVGKKAVVLGRSLIVGKPIAYLLKNAGASVRVINRKTSQEDIKVWIKEADLIISATGVKDIVRPDMVKKGVDIIDVGIIRDEDKLRGDTQHQKFMGVAKHITPVPGGVGPMTVTMLMCNIIELTKKWGKGC